MSEHTATAALIEQLESLVNGARDFEKEHGSVECIVGPNSPIAKAGVEQVHGFRIQVDDVRLVDTKGSEPDMVIDGALVYFVTHDHPMFGSKAEDEGEWWDTE